MIKIQEESQGGTSTKDDMIKILTNFHDDDSEAQNCLIPAYTYTGENVYEVIENHFDIRVTPIKEMQSFIREHYTFEEEEIRNLNSGILKKKKILKRQRAKNRNMASSEIKIEPNYYSSSFSVPIDLTCDENEKKKKRNRISAQISRDKKKVYLQELERENHRLQKECTTIKQENKGLKEELNQYKKATNETNSTGEVKSRFLKLLIFLGLLFFVSLVKEAFKPRNHRKEGSYTIYSANQQVNVVNKAQSYVDELEFPCLKEQMSKAMISFKNKAAPVSLPTGIYETIQQTTSDFSQ